MIRYLIVFRFIEVKEIKITGPNSVLKYRIELKHATGVKETVEVVNGAPKSFTT